LALGEVQGERRARGLGASVGQGCHAWQSWFIIANRLGLMTYLIQFRQGCHLPRERSAPESWRRKAVGYWSN
jgi:hypothetical protein